MYSRLIEDHPYDHVEQRSPSKSVFTLPLVLLFALVGIASTRHLMNANANSSLESMVAEPDGEGAFGIAPAAASGSGGGSAAAPSACTEWWCIDKCAAHNDDSDYRCDVVLTLDLGSSGTKPALWAIRQKKDKKKIPEMHLARSIDNDELKYKGFCGIWSDKYQFPGDLRDYCVADFESKTIPDTELYPKKCAGLKEDFAAWKKHFETQMKCILDHEPMGVGSKKIKELITATYGGITAGLRNDPLIRNKFEAFKEGTTATADSQTGGDVWHFMKVQTGKPVHLRMISGEEEAYYEWLSFNWDTLQAFENGSPINSNDLKNTLSIGGASAQIAVPTVHPMSTLDHTYYFHIGVDKYWIYANSIMWAGTTRLKTMYEEFGFGTTLEGTALDDEFFNKNNELLCSDIFSIQTTAEAAETLTLGPKQLYKGVCVMGFHFPSADQWITNQFLGSKDWNQMVGKGGCMEAGKTGGQVNLDWDKKCDGLTKAAVRSKAADPFWAKNNPKTLLPFWGRFFHKMIETGYPDGSLDYSLGAEKSWSAVWAAMWMHGKFQGFPNLKGRRNLGGLKGEYTLGPLTIPAHFGTPEDSS